MFQAGVSILLTSLTDVIGFYSAILAPYPYVQIFCIYTGFYSKIYTFDIVFCKIIWHPFGTFNYSSLRHALFYCVVQ
jgi:hypothetical protein